MKRRMIIAVLAAVIALAVLTVGVLAADLPFANLFENLSSLFGGYTSDEGQILAPDYVSSKEIAVSEGETVWFGPCDPTQYFQLVGQNTAGETVTDKIRGKDLTVVDTFNNGMVIYSYTVPSGVNKLVFTAPESVAEVYSVAKTEINELSWRAYWDQQGKDTDRFVGQSSYYKVVAGDKLYFGAVTEKEALSSKLYSDGASAKGTMAKEDLELVESFGGDYGIYCYTVPENVAYVYVTYDADREQYYHCVQLAAGETVETKKLVSDFIVKYAVVQPLESTVKALSGKTALFLGDSITFGARDRANIYGVVDSVNPGAGGWAARIGYYCGMDVTNNGVSGACITTARQESHSTAHYIYNNLVKTEGTTYDYVIMHGLFNDASIPVELGTMTGKADFDPAKADVTKFADALELLFYTAKQQNPNAVLGYIVNFHTERAVDQAPYVELAIRICKDWGVPYLDLYNRAGFQVEFDDGLHPSSAGYDSMYTIVANWMASLAGEEDAKSNASSANIMSYNIFWDVSQKSGSEYSDIADRAQKVMELIAQRNPDILLLQEFRSGWWSSANQYLSDYSYYGYSSGYNNHSVTAVENMTGGDEAAPIFWKTSKYELVKSGYFHVDDGQFAEDGQSVYPRTINWVILKDKVTGGQLLVMNYHAVPDKDAYNGEAARNATAQLVMQTIDQLRTEYKGIPVILGGDCNMSTTSTAYYTVVGNGVLDVSEAAETTVAYGSYNKWNRTDPATFAKGDYLFVSDDVTAESYRVLYQEDVDSATGKHISDHSPLEATIYY